MEGSNSRRGRSPPKVDHDSSTSINSTSSSDAMIDSETKSAATAQLFPTINDNGGPSSDPPITSASSVQHYTTDLSGLNTPSNSAPHSDNTMPEIQSAHQPPTQNRMAISYILNTDSPQPSGFPDSSKVIGDSTAHGKQSGSASSATQQIKRRRCGLSRLGLEDLEKNRLMYLNQIEFSEKSIRDLERGSSEIKSADILISSIAKSNEILQRKRRRLGQIINHQHKRKEAEREAKKSRLQLIANGTYSTVYAVPESFGNSVIQVGTRGIMMRKRQRILLVEQSFEKMNFSAGNRSSSSWLKSLLLPQIETLVPTGFEGDSATGLVRPCTSLNPRIPSVHGTNGKSRSVDSDEQFGIVLRRIKGLDDISRSNILKTCYGFLSPKMREALRTNEHCLVRIYLGKTYDDGDLVYAGDSVSDVTMKDAGEASATTVNDEFLPTLDLPLCLDRVTTYLDYLSCGRRHEKEILKGFAQQIASGYAGLHWGTRLDARGIKFVLGSPPSGLGKQLYMLDFDDCRPIESLNRRCVQEQLVPAALENDPYIPRLSCRSRCVCRLFMEYEPIKACIWYAFKDRYLEDSAKIWDASGRDFERDLPRVFIDQLERGFVNQGTQRLANGVSYRHVPGVPSDVLAEYGGSDDEEDFENDGGDGANQAQAGHEFFENDNYGNDGYDLGAMGIDDSSEGQEDSEDEEDDFDDVD